MDIEDAISKALAEFRASLRKTGKVTGTSGSKVIVTVDGGSLTLARLAQYVPTVGDVVNVDCAKEGSWLVLGKTA